MRVLLTGVVVWLLKLPGLMLGGGLLLLPIAIKLLVPEPDEEHRIGPADSFWSALRTIIVADALRGLDNVLAIAGASRGHMGLVVLGLLISVPLVVWGSTLILRLIGRFPIIVYIGAAAIAWTAARMISQDRWLLPWFDAHPWATYTLDTVLVIAVCCIGWWMAVRERKARLAAGK
jgi:YjbE family integral membrane protein